jgi:hypothetical protein
MVDEAKHIVGRKWNAFLLFKYSLRREIDDATSIHFTFCKKTPKLPILLPLGPFYLKSNPELSVVLPVASPAVVAVPRRPPPPSAVRLRRVCPSAAYYAQPGVLPPSRLVRSTRSSGGGT